MQSKSVNQYPRDAVEKLLAAIPFFKEIKKQDVWQFEVLLQHSRLLFCQPEEVIVEQGSRDDCLYFLIKGQLLVQVREQNQVVNSITPGEVFGDLSMLLEQPRTATVVADSSSREVIVFSLDFSVFGALLDFNHIKLSTKLTYYRNLVHSLRWKLEVYRGRFGHHALANRHRLVPLFRGLAGTTEELLALREQARQMAELLLCWNHEFGYLDVAERAPLDKQALNELSA